MASDVLGAQIDIHSGGIDLCFPRRFFAIIQAAILLLITLQITITSWRKVKPTGLAKLVAISGLIIVRFILLYTIINLLTGIVLHMGHLSISGSKMVRQTSCLSTYLSHCTYAEISTDLDIRVNR